MRDYPLYIYVESDKKQVNIKPVVGRISDGVGTFGYIFAKHKYTCDASALGKSVKDGFEYIQNKYVKNEDIDAPNDAKKIPWTKRGSINIVEDRDGNFSIISEYVDHEIMTVEHIEKYQFPSNISDEEMGKAVITALEQSFDYALRKELAVYYSEKEGLLFVPMVRNRTGYITADFCCCVKDPYSPQKVREAIDSVLQYISNNPEDKRTNKERKAMLPWREYSKYKSLHGFIKTHHSMEIHVLTDGSFVFLPTLRVDSYDSRYVVYECLKSIYSNDITDRDLVNEIFATLEICDLIYEKGKEKDNSCHHDIFFNYVKELSSKRNNRL